MTLTEAVRELMARGKFRGVAAMDSDRELRCEICNRIDCCCGEYGCCR